MVWLYRHIKKKEHILTRLLAEMNAIEERTDANLSEMKAEIRTEQRNDGKAGSQDRGQ
jgi:hypothetical protein